MSTRKPTTSKRAGGATARFLVLLFAVAVPLTTVLAISACDEMGSSEDAEVLSCGAFEEDICGACNNGLPSDTNCCHAQREFCKAVRCKSSQGRVQTSCVKR